MDKNTIHQIQGGLECEATLQFNHCDEKTRNLNKFIAPRYSMCDLSGFEQIWELLSSREISDEQRLDVFGEEFLKYIDGLKMGTLTEAGNQFRLWSGPPAGYIGWDHVDSRGRNLIFSAQGDDVPVVIGVKNIVFPKETKTYDSRFDHFKETKGPNGSKIYIPAGS